MRDKGQDQPNHSNMTGHEILFGPFIEQLLPFLKRVPEKMKVIKKWFASMVNSPKLLFFLFFAFIFGMWGGYIFLMKCSPEWFVNMLPNNIIQANPSESSALENYALLGDSYGFINSFFAALTFLGFLYTLHQQNKSIKLQQVSIIEQTKSSQEQISISRAQIQTTWMQEAMMLISYLSDKMQKLSISYTCEDGITSQTKTGTEVIKLTFELSCLVCVFKLASSLARKRGSDSLLCDFYFCEVKNTFNDCLFELKQFMILRKYVINRIISYSDLSMVEKEQLLFTLPLEGTKEIILLRALMMELTCLDNSNEHNEFSCLGATDMAVKERARLVLVKNTSCCLGEVVANVIKKQRRFANYCPTEYERIITYMNSELQNPDNQKELQDIANQLIDEGMEMSL